MLKPNPGEMAGDCEFIKTSGSSPEGRVLGIFRCSCGKEFEHSIGRVFGLYVRSCGHLRSEGRPNLTHGMRNSPEYRSWSSMRTRCLNPKNKDYGKYSKLDHDSVLDSFEDFFLEVGHRPHSGYSIDRIDTQHGYRKGNIRWAPRGIQQKNKSGSFMVEIDGVLFDSPSDVASHFGVARATVGKWCHGWTDKRRNKKWEPRKGLRMIPKYPKGVMLGPD